MKEVAPTTGAIDKLRYSNGEYQVAVSVKAVMDETTGNYSGLTTSNTVTQVNDDMGNTVSNTIGKDAAPNAIPASTFTNTYSTTLPLSGMSGVTVTYLAGAAVLCAAAYNDEKATAAIKEMLDTDKHFLSSFECFMPMLAKNKKLTASIIK